VSLYDPTNTARLPVFKLQLCLEETKKEFEFYPSFSDLEAALLSAVDVVGGAMKKVPDIQVKVEITVASLLWISYLPPSLRELCNYSIQLGPEQVLKLVD